MNKRMFLTIGLVLGLILTGSLAFAGINDDVGTTTANFLKNMPGARPDAMGGAFTAMMGDANAILWNPASMGWSDEKEFTFTYNQMDDDIHSSFVAGLIPVGSADSIGMAVTVFNVGRIPETNEGGIVGRFDAKFYSLVAGYSRILNEDLSVGGNIKYIHQDLDVETADTFAVDLGGQYILDDINTVLGVSVQNLGTSAKFVDQEDDLPITYRIGAAYEGNYSIADYTLAVDVEIPDDNDTNVHVGTEVWLYDTFAIRTGYESKDELEESLAQWSFGLGLKGNMRKVSKYSDALVMYDYSFSDQGDLGQSHFISVSTRF
jgi:long-subunit fatty acid transport protein